MSNALLTRDSLAERQGGVWEYISPSRINTWLACPLKFKLKYIDGVRAPTSPAMFVGKMTHAGLECYYRHKQLGMTLDSVDLARRVVESWGEAAEADGIAFDTVAAELASRSQTIMLLDAYLKQIPADEPKPLAVETAIEAPLIDPATGENLGIPLVGVMDLVLPEIEGPVITDFKTTSRSSEPYEIVHEIQLSSYAYLFRHTSHEPEAALEIRNLIKTKTAKIETHRYAARSERHFRRLFSVVRAYLDDLDAGRFIYRPGLGCGMCDFRNTFCRHWAG